MKKRPRRKRRTRRVETKEKKPTTAKKERKGRKARKRKKNRSRWSLTLTESASASCRYRLRRRVTRFGHGQSGNVVPCGNRGRAALRAYSDNRFEVRFHDAQNGAISQRNPGVRGLCKWREGSLSAKRRLVDCGHGGRAETGRRR